jgi:hypothetical protein
MLDYIEKSTYKKWGHAFSSRGYMMEFVLGLIKRAYILFFINEQSQRKI